MRLLKWAVLFQMMKVEIDEQLMKTSLERPMENILEQQATANPRFMLRSIN
jgi:hypothetical protein